MNGVKQTVEGRPGEWMPVSKTWRDQDTIMVKIGMPLYFEKIDNKNKDIVSLLYGPVVLVSDDLAAFCEDPDHVEEWIERVPGERLKFRTKPGATILKQGILYPTGPIRKENGIFYIFGSIN